jgi:hypothetical protein
MTGCLPKSADSNPEQHFGHGIANMHARHGYGARCVYSGQEVVERASA